MSQMAYPNRLGHEWRFLSNDTPRGGLLLTTLMLSTDSSSLQQTISNLG